MVYNKNTHIKMLISQMIQQKNRDENIKQAKDEMKVSFYGSGCGLETIF